jgi:hypothetical protein
MVGCGGVEVSLIEGCDGWRENGDRTLADGEEKG